ncbi:MAG: phytanoyl-CoA dioxygenase, partial [Gammaproteobacteria bacterium]|nr:phytanoyl-CoA dioxygenase [Gammaproteobacteria bacterium]
MHISLEDFISSLEPQAQNYRYSAQVMQGVPIYNGDTLRSLTTISQIAGLQQEWAQTWLDGAGIIVISGFYAEAEPVQAMTGVMLQLLQQENRSKSQIGDHFSQASNGRLWNALEKVAVLNPEAFIDYYQNPLIDMVAKAWLGPDYTVTSQVNLVPPGGSPQQPHRDYHLGFQDDDSVRRYPLHAQIMSACLTLQGAVAHIDMPVESGPTRILPYSQRYKRGYQLFRNAEFKTYFDENAIQLPLSLGDAVFFNPALMHGAGENRSSHIKRIANLLQ